jgi:hypothetical protein
LALVSALAKFTSAKIVETAATLTNTNLSKLCEDLGSMAKPPAAKSESVSIGIGTREL